jgi:hypothetical protein
LIYALSLARIKNWLDDYRNQCLTPFSLVSFFGWSQPIFQYHLRLDKTDTPLGQVNLSLGSRYEGHMGVSYWEEQTTGDYGQGVVLTREGEGMRIDNARQTLLKPAGAVVRAVIDALGKPIPESLLLPSEQEESFSDF